MAKGRRKRKDGKRKLLEKGVDHIGTNETLRLDKNTNLLEFGGETRVENQEEERKN